MDADNDEQRDLLVAQGHVLDTIELTSPHLRYRQRCSSRAGRRALHRRVVHSSDVFTAGWPAAAWPLATSTAMARGRRRHHDERSAVVLMNTSEARGTGPASAGRHPQQSRRHRRSDRVDDGTGRRQTATVSTTGITLGQRSHRALRPRRRIGGLADCSMASGAVQKVGGIVAIA